MLMLRPQLPAGAGQATWEKDSAPNRHSHLLGDRKGLVLTILALCCHLQNHTSNSQKHGNDIHVVFDFVSVPIHSHPQWHASLYLDIPGIFNRADLRARHTSHTREWRLRGGGSGCDPHTSLTPNPKPQTRTSSKRPRLMDSPSPGECLPCVEPARSRDSDPARLLPATIT